MQFVSGWSTPDKRVLINFDEKVLNVFRQHIQNLATDPEAGGLLLGEVAYFGERDRSFRSIVTDCPRGHFEHV